METVRPSKNKKDKAIVTKKGVRVTISIPKDLFEKIENNRGDVTRSRYITSLLKLHI